MSKLERYVKVGKVCQSWNGMSKLERYVKVRMVCQTNKRSSLRSQFYEMILFRRIFKHYRLCFKKLGQFSEAFKSVPKESFSKMR